MIECLPPTQRFYRRFSCRRLTRSIAAILGVVLISSSLTSCVANEEQGTPDGWQQILPPKNPELAAQVPADLAARGVLTIGANPPFPPLEFKNSRGEIIGVEMDLARATAAILGLDFRPLEQDFSLILPSIQSGTLDMGASGFTDNEERRKNFDFVDFLYAGVQWAQRTDADYTVDPDNACGLTVAVQRTTVAETDDVRPKSADCVAAGKKPITVLAYDTADAATTALVLGRADAMSADSPITAYATARADGKIKETGEMFSAAPFGFALPKNSPLTPVVARAFDQLIASGDYQRILDQWGIDQGLLERALISEQPLP